MNVTSLHRVVMFCFYLVPSFGIMCCQDESRVDQKKYENYGDIYSDDLSLFTSPTNHPHGYGKKNCFLCHNIQNIHQVDLISSLDVDLNEIHARITTEGLGSCLDCHGENGTGE